MIKQLLFVLCCCTLATVVSAQVKKKPAPKKTVAKKPVPKGKKIITTTGKTMLSLQVIKDDATYFYDIVKGDKLVYEVNANGNKYDFIVTINNYDYNTGIDFAYEMTNESKTKGRVRISSKALQSSKKYVNYFTGGELKLVDALTVWMSYDNFNEISTRKTNLTFDNGAAETFYRPEADAVNPEIVFKGENVVLDGFKMTNEANGSGSKEVWVHNISSNPLILKMDIGIIIELRAVR
ncbi:MAG: hypothetical protein EAY75_03760 [Bacteroidetes bacterium]|nr:MAG: hypothetical protein EAY75_03760 [Bacteroidota bacterium]